MMNDAAAPQHVRANRPGALADALVAWRVALGEDVVRVEPEVLARYGRGDVSDAPQPEAVLRVTTREQVVLAVGVASRFGVGLYPISQGQNWGYGAACPVTSGQVVLDMRGMNRIVTVDSELAYAVVEPGVTQKQLATHLVETNARLILDCTDAPSNTSLMGNCLDRGIGFSALGYRAQTTCGMELVLADGSVLQTGYGGLGSTDLAYTRRHGVGPSLEGLFSQSSLGIVTKLGVWLMPRPERIASFWIVAEDDERFVAALEALRDLMLSAGICTVVHAGNWLGPRGWVLFGGLYGTQAYVAYAQGAVLAAVERAGAMVHFIDPSDRRWEQRAVTQMVARLPASALPIPANVVTRSAMRALGFAGFVKPFRPLLDPLGKFVRILAGQPIDEALMQSGHLPLDQEGKAAQRHVTLSATCTVRKDDVRAMLAMLRGELERGGRKEGLWCAMHDARSITFIQHLRHPTGDAAEEARTLECYEAIFDAAMQRGFFPYRVANRSMQRLDPNRTTYWQTVRKLKEALDPTGAISPGKYLPD